MITNVFRKIRGFPPHDVQLVSSDSSVDTLVLLKDVVVATRDSRGDISDLEFSDGASAYRIFLSAFANYATNCRLSAGHRRSVSQLITSGGFENNINVYVLIDGKDVMLLTSSYLLVDDTDKKVHISSFPVKAKGVTASGELTNGNSYSAILAPVSDLFNDDCLVWGSHVVTSAYYLYTIASAMITAAVEAERLSKERWAMMLHSLTIANTKIDTVDALTSDDMSNIDLITMETMCSRLFTASNFSGLSESLGRKPQVNNTATGREDAAAKQRDFEQTFVELAEETAYDYEGATAAQMDDTRSQQRQYGQMCGHNQTRSRGFSLFAEDLGSVAKYAGVATAAFTIAKLVTGASDDSRDEPPTKTEARNAVITNPANDDNEKTHAVPRWSSNVKTDDEAAASFFFS